MNQLVIRVSAADGYTVQFASGPERENILRAFYTDTLPLPFAAGAKTEHVTTFIKAAYPQARIETEDQYLGRISEEIR